MVKLSKEQLNTLTKAHQSLQFLFSCNGSTRMSLSDIHSACQTGKELVMNGRAKTAIRSVADFFSDYLKVTEEKGFYVLEV